MSDFDTFNGNGYPGRSPGVGGSSLSPPAIYSVPNSPEYAKYAARWAYQLALDKWLLGRGEHPGPYTDLSVNW